MSEGISEFISSKNVFNAIKCMKGNMKERAIIILALCISFTIVTADIDTAASASYTDVSAAVSAAGSGDTVFVPEGTATWDQALCITKGIIIHGAGSGKTVITGNITDKYAGVVKYEPENPALNEPFRITGFTLDANNMSNVVYLTNRTIDIVNQIRVDHNEILNPGGQDAGRSIIIKGTVYGVIDHNLFRVSGSALGSYGMQGSSWESLTRDFGTADNIYFEDNTVYTTTTFHAAGHGGRYCSRYNTFICSTGNLFPMFDMHGNQTGNLHGTMMGEIYGNRIDMTSNGGGLVDQRGGQALVFFNQLTAGLSVSCKIREEYPDDLDGAPYLMHVTNSYYWNNRKNGTLVHTEVKSQEDRTAAGGGNDYLDYTGSDLTYFGTDGRYGVILYEGTEAGQHRHITAATSSRLTVNPAWDVPPDETTQFRVVDDRCGAVHENSEYFNHDTAFDGHAEVNTLYGPLPATGIGCGPLADRPDTCTPGVAYWATDQSCTTVSDSSVGANPKVPISGTLYKCTAQDTWEAYYTPFTYPHPLTLGIVDIKNTPSDNVKDFIFFHSRPSGLLCIEGITGKAAVEIYTMRGRLLHRNVINSSKLTIDFRDKKNALRKGCFVLRLQMGERSVTKRFVLYN